MWCEAVDKCILIKRIRAVHGNMCFIGVHCTVLRACSCFCGTAPFLLPVLNRTFNFCFKSILPHNNTVMIQQYYHNSDITFAVR